MSVVLTIEPDSSQAEASRGILASREGVELVLVTSTGAAIEAIDRQVPDLILVSALLSPRDEAEIVAHLRSIDDAGHLQTLTIPQLRRAEEPSRVSSFFGKKKKKPAAAPARCDPAVFAEEGATYLARARELRNQASVARRGPPAAGAEQPSPPSRPPSRNRRPSSRALRPATKRQTKSTACFSSSRLFSRRNPQPSCRALRTATKR